MGMVKKDIDTVVTDTEQEYYFTPASADEELDLNTYRYYTTIHVDSSSYSGVVTLPNVAEAKGMTYTVRIHVGTNAVTVQDRDDSEGWTDVTTLDAANDSLTVKSDGIRWITVESNIS